MALAMTPSTFRASAASLGSVHYLGTCSTTVFHHRLANSSLKSVAARPQCVKVRSMSDSTGQTEDLIKSKNERNAVVVYSKTTCPYCGRVKTLFKDLGVKIITVELNELVDGAAIQSALKRLTGQSTVPNVFIGGKHIGGCDDTVALHQQGKLLPLLTEAGATISDA